MIIQICSQKEAIALAEKAEVRTSIISITSKEGKDVVFSENPNIVSVLRLAFNDLAEEYDEEGIPYGRALPKQEDFAGLKGFVNHLRVECLIVHCWEGRSRSAAVAKAIYEYRGCRDEMHMEKENALNPLVCTLARRELEG